MSRDAILRPLLATDISRVVEIHLSAFPEFFLSFLGPKFLHLFYAQAVELGEIALVIEVEGSIVGFVVGSACPSGFFKRLLYRKAFLFALAAIPSILRQPSSFLRVARALLKPAEAARPAYTATLMSLAVDQEAQRGGIGRMLAIGFLAEAARRGAKCADLTTDKFGNDGVNIFYRKLGFRVVRELITPERRVMNVYEIDLL